jgi:hypothetical protein
MAEEAKAETKRTLTLADIQSSEYLRKNGVLAGDVFDISTDEIIRVFSTPEDSVSEGKILTQEDIDSSLYLQENNVVAGDRFYDDVIHRSSTDDVFTQFKYGFDKGGNLISYGADILETYFPLGELTIDFNGINYQSPDDLHGEGYKAASPDERREMLLREKERALQEDYGQFFEEQDGLAGAAGGFVKAIADPTSLIPLGAGYKTMAAGAGALGIGYSVTEDVATTGEVDPVKAAITGLLAATATPALVAGGRAISSKVASRSAEKLTEKAQAVINKRIAEGAPVDKPAQILMDEGINPAKVEAAFKLTGKQLRIPATVTRAEKAIEEAITRDSAVSRLYSKGLDTYLGTLSTRVRNISEPVFGRLRKYEFNIHVNTQNVLKEVEPFLKGLSETAPAIKGRIASHLYNGNFDAAEGLMKATSPEMYEAFVNTTKNTISRTGDELAESGHVFGKIDNYFPRLVKDYDGLRASLGKEEQGSITKALEDYAKRKDVSVSSLTSTERSEVIDLTLRGYRMDPSGAKPRFLKPRTLRTIQPEQLQYYASPEESLSMYLRNSVDDIEKRKFFGKATEESSGGIVDPDRSIGNFIDEELSRGAIPAGREDELKELLKSRFVGGAQSPSKTVSFLRDTGYMGTIANPISALTQLADMGTTAALKGFRNTIASMLGTKETRLIDLGLENTITKELGGDLSKTARALTKMLKLTGFQSVDRLGKETYINASLKKARSLVKSAEGESAFRKRQGSVYGDELDSLVADLKNGTVSENVKFFLFNELADIQPITLSEMPQGYLDSTNGRLLYMLKSFTLKQYDIVRREVVKEWKQGNKGQAIKNAGLLAGYLTAANVGVQTTKDILLGREVRPEDLPEKSLWALLGIYGLNKYTSERYLERGDIKGAVVNTLVPATPLIEAAITVGRELPKDDPNLEPALKGIPIVGPMFYNWFGGGAEKYNERLD